MIMKKILIACSLIVCCFSVGCSRSSNQAALNSDQIKYKDSILSYNDTEISDDFFTDGIDFVINDENKIRSITIENKDVVTFNEISIGDKSSKIESKYKYEQSYNDTYMVLLDGNSEINIEKYPDSERENNWLWINYYIDDDTISKIVLYDYEYGKYMK